MQGGKIGVFLLWYFRIEFRDDRWEEVGESVVIQNILWVERGNRVYATPFNRKRTFI